MRDSRPGYLVPARDGSALLPDWESCWDAAAAVTWKFRLTFWPRNYIWSFQIGFWHIWELSEIWYRGSTRNLKPDLSSIVIWPGEPFWRNVYLVHISKNQTFIVWGQTGNSKCWQHIQNVQTAISTISAHPKFKFSNTSNKYLKSLTSIPFGEPIGRKCVLTWGCPSHDIACWQESSCKSTWMYIPFV